MTAQLVILATGLIAVSLLMGDNRHFRRAAPWIGLVGQPFWLWETWHATQAGMFVLSCGYTLIYLLGCWDSLRRRSELSSRPGAPPFKASVQQELSMIELGKKYRDTITGLEGIALVRCEYLHGVERVELQPVVDKDGKLPTALWIESSRLEPIAEAA